ncbi:AfsA-related hotdog domain-containing protein [Actinoplanes sp. N902-109]|uniref:AfsA-related hotdog domain-containing protein n=1 Tax=Actinoplanes sp. (strain N902-109) TaxID=649831 RepID=UPI0003293810|nr:AfsA-related hotdog domain-containing protein [Actinoplanes sp. N902-109]AGL13741.1 putative gamma-butyrolactone biosynthesis protein [Actinoplanes sp. N902-109]
MSVTHLSEAAPSPPVLQPAFVRTVDRRLVHRRAVHEVFLTGGIREDERNSIAYAQLPIAHPYYLDTAPGPARYDALLLTECARQACTYVAHTQYDVPADWVLLAAVTEIELTDPGALRVGREPAELTMRMHSTPTRRAGSLRVMDTDIRLEINGTHAGFVHGSGRYLTADEYRLLRAGDGEGPRSTSMALTRAGNSVPVPARLVGRRDAGNVVLADGRQVDGGATARLDVPGDHPSIFDHALDHYPAMVLLDGAVRMTALSYALSTGSSDPDIAISRLAAEFDRFAELDAPVELTARLDRVVGNRLDAVVAVSQQGQLLCEVAVSALVTETPAGEHR